MLLTLIKTRQTRYGIHAVLIETNHIFGDKILSELYIPQDEDVLNLIFRLTITHSGLWIQGKHIDWLWPNRQKKRQVYSYLRSIQKTREEIRIDVQNWDQN